MASKKQAKLYFEYAKRFPEHHTKIAKEIAKIAKIRKEDSILEIGVGTGASTKVFLRYLNKKGALDGIDHSRNMLYFFKKDIKNNKIRRIINGDAKNIYKHFKNNKYDKILCSNSFWAIEEREKFLQGVSKLLKKDGRLIFSIYGTRIIEYNPKKTKNLLNKFNIKYLKNETKIIFIKRSKKGIKKFRIIKAKKIKKQKHNLPRRLKKIRKEWIRLGVKINEERTPLIIYSGILK